MTTKSLPPRTESFPPLVSVCLRPVVELGDGRLLALSCWNGDLRLEHTAEGELVLMPSTIGETSSGNTILTHQVTGWALRDGTGVAFFDPDRGFVLPNGAMRAPMPPGCSASGWRT